MNSKKVLQRTAANEKLAESHNLYHFGMICSMESELFIQLIWGTMCPENKKSHILGHDERLQMKRSYPLGHEILQQGGRG